MPAVIASHALTDADVVVCTGATIIAVVAESWTVRSCVVAGALIWALRPTKTPAATVVLAVIVGALAVAGGMRGVAAWNALEPDQLGRYDGWAAVVDEGKPYDSSARIVVEIEGERFEVWGYGTAATERLMSWRGGEQVFVSGERVALRDDRVRRVAWQHVVGQFEVDWAADRRVGSPVARLSNDVRRAIEEAGHTLPGDDGALYRGLVIGDDRDQPETMIERFRNSGLAHLTAVSGQNVAFVLAAAGPLLRTLSPWWRWGVTCVLIAWFVALTRFEPSIVRAGVMAAITATAFARGRPQRPVRTLGLAVTLLVLVDPLLVWSIGFWLSVGATAGVVIAGPWLAERLRRWGPLALPIGITLGAQLGVALPSVLVFHRLPLMSLPANLLAGPVAGFVMLYGLPAGLLAAAVPLVSSLVMFPVRLGVRWVDTVAVVADALEPSPHWAAVGWIALAVVVVIAVLHQRGAREGDERPQ